MNTVLLLGLGAVIEIVLEAIIRKIKDCYLESKKEVCPERKALEFEGKIFREGDYYINTQNKDPFSEHFFAHILQIKNHYVKFCLAFEDGYISMPTQHSIPIEEFSKIYIPEAQEIIITMDDTKIKKSIQRAINDGLMKEKQLGKN